MCAEPSAYNYAEHPECVEWSIAACCFSFLRCRLTLATSPNPLEPSSAPNASVRTCSVGMRRRSDRHEATQSVPETEKSAQQGASDHGGSGSVALPISISVALVVVVGALGLFVYVRRLTPQKAHMTVESAVPQQSSGVKLEMQQAAHLGSFRLDAAGLVPEIWC